jgi:hypothetical protein
MKLYICRIIGMFLAILHVQQYDIYVLREREKERERESERERAKLVGLPIPAQYTAFTCAGQYLSDFMAAKYEKITKNKRERKRGRERSYNSVPESKIRTFFCIPLPSMREKEKL